MLDHLHQKSRYQFARNFDAYLHAKNQLHPSQFHRDIAKILETCYFQYFGHVWLCALKVILSTCRKLSCFSAGKKMNFFTTFFWRYCKDMKTSYFGYFEHAWLCTHKMIEPTCRKRRCLSACHKYFSLFTSFLRYCILKNLVI